MELRVIPSFLKEDSGVAERSPGLIRVQKLSNSTNFIYYIYKILTIDLYIYIYIYIYIHSSSYIEGCIFLYILLSFYLSHPLPLSLLLNHFRSLFFKLSLSFPIPNSFSP